MADFEYRFDVIRELMPVLAACSSSLKELALCVGVLLWPNEVMLAIHNATPMLEHLAIFTSEVYPVCMLC